MTLTFTVLPYVCHACHGRIRRGGASTSERMLDNLISLSKNRVLMKTPNRSAQYRALTHGRWRSNRTLNKRNLNRPALTVRRFDGAALGEPYVPPEHEGPLPTAIGGAEEHKLYTGSCHCGAVTISLRSKPIDETFKGTAECNCSICGRVRSTPVPPSHNTRIFNTDA
jgi:hypothetical protein